jgi:hypothetical protein
MLFGISPESCSASPRNAVRLAPEYARDDGRHLALSANGVFHAAEVSRQPIVSTHQNLERYVKSRPLVEIMDEEAQAIAKTGGIVGIRYIVNVTPFKLLVDEVEYLAKLIGGAHWSRLAGP